MGLEIFKDKIKQLEDNCLYEVLLSNTSKGSSTKYMFSGLDVYYSLPGWVEKYDLVSLYNRYPDMILLGRRLNKKTKEVSNFSFGNTII